MLPNSVLLSLCSLLGTVFVGKCRGITVAIKKLNELTLDDELLEDFRKEVNILRYAVTFR